jgi:hypothetical protein
MGRLGLRSLAVAALAALAWSGVVSAPASAAAAPLVGTFSIVPGSCSGGAIAGTYLRMVLSGGSNSAGPYFSNSDSSCADNSYTPLAPGSAGGLVTGGYQPEPSPAFDGAGNALAAQITRPVAFEGVKFATATNSVDPQTAQRVPAPSIVATGSALSGNLEAFGVSWNNQQFNQGSPKPGGGAPGNTTPVTGTYNPATGAYTLQWSSQVVGGPFNGFSAFWNLTGTFTPAAGASSSSSAASAPSSAGATTPAASSSGHGTAASSGGATSTASGVAGAAAGATTTSTTTTTTATTTHPASASPRVVLTAHTVVRSSGGWNTPAWEIVLLALLAALGLGGLVWSERARRQQGAST